jgi:hypothetical protein
MLLLWVGAEMITVGTLTLLALVSKFLASECRAHKPWPTTNSAKAKMVSPPPRTKPLDTLLE